MNHNYYKTYGGLAVFLSVASVGSAAVVTTNDSGGADAAFRVTTPAVTEGNATSPISFDAAGAPAATNIGAIAFRFGVGAAGVKSNATLSFVYRRNNSAGFSLYGLKDGAAGNNWAESTLTAADAVANGWITTDGSTLAATASLTNLGTIALTGTSSNTVRTYPNGGTESLPSTAFDDFLSTDTDGLVTLLLIPSSSRSPFVYGREAAGTALTVPTLGFTNTEPVSTPEPASIAGVAVLSVLGLRRTRRGRN